MKMSDGVLFGAPARLFPACRGADEREDRRRARSLATRQAIMDAGEALALEHGMAGLRTKDLVERSGVSERTVFNHFPTLEAIALSRIEEYLVPLLAATHVPPGLPLEELPGAVQAALRENLDTARAREGLIGFLRLAAAMAATDGELLARQVVVSLVSIADRMGTELFQEYPGLSGDQQIRLRMYLTHLAFALAFGLARTAYDHEVGDAEHLEAMLENIPALDELIDGVHWAFDQVDGGRPSL